MIGIIYDKTTPMPADQRPEATVNTPTTVNAARIAVIQDETFILNTDQYLAVQRINTVVASGFQPPTARRIKDEFGRTMVELIYGELHLQIDVGGDLWSIKMFTEGKWLDLEASELRKMIEDALFEEPSED